MYRTTFLLKFHSDYKYHLLNNLSPLIGNLLAWGLKGDPLLILFSLLNLVKR